MSTPTRSTSSEQLLARYRAAAERTAEQQRAIQVEVDRKDERAAKQKKDQKSDKRAVQAGVRTQPENPLPKQHLAKPGLEVQLEPRPRFLAPDYKGSEKLKNMVAIVYLNEHEDAEETRRAVEDEGRRCITISGDVRDPEFCTFAVEHTVNELGHLEVLVNNAAFQEHVTSLEELSDEHLEMTMRTNVFGYVQMARAALPYLPPGGSIINTGSETGFFGAPQLLDYSATKGAIHAFTMALAGNVKSRDIRVNAIAPGPVWTPLNPADKPAEKVSEFGAESDMQRPAQPEELAPAYVFLASPVCSSYITGVLLPVMGGAQG